MPNVCTVGYNNSLAGFIPGIEQSLSDPLGSGEPQSLSGYFTPSRFAQCTGELGDLSIWTMNSPGGKEG